MTMAELFEGGSQNTHPAFRVESTEKDVMYISKFQNIVLNDRAYSLPMRDPKTYVNFDQAVTFCRNKGNGWGLTPYALWSAIALWCRKNGTMPRGNNNWGKMPRTHTKRVFRLHLKVKVQKAILESLPDALLVPDRQHGITTGCRMALLI